MANYRYGATDTDHGILRSHMIRGYAQFSFLWQRFLKIDHGERVSGASPALGRRLGESVDFTYFGGISWLIDWWISLWVDLIFCLVRTLMPSDIYCILISYLCI